MIIEPIDPRVLDRSKEPQVDNPKWFGSSAQMSRNPYKATHADVARLRHQSLRKVTFRHLRSDVLFPAPEKLRIHDWWNHPETATTDSIYDAFRSSVDEYYRLIRASAQADAYRLIQESDGARSETAAEPNRDFTLRNCFKYEPRSTIRQILSVVAFSRRPIGGWSDMKVTFIPPARFRTSP